MLGPFRDSQREAVCGVPHVAAAVAALRFLVRPTAIFRRVAAINIDSVDAVLVAWARPHVGVKRLKRIAPPSAYSDAASAIQREAFVCWIFAASDHAGPRAVFRRLAHAVRDYLVGPRATTRFDFACAELVGAYSRFAAAVAMATPKDARAASADWLDSGQVVKPLAGDINGALEHVADSTMRRLPDGMRDIIAAALAGRPVSDAGAVGAGGDPLSGDAAGAEG